MILVDTSIWINHFRRGSDRLATLLEAGEVLGHPFVTGELACGSLHARREILSLLEALPQAVAADHQEVLRFVDSRQLMGRGLGYVDVHLLASVMLHGATIWTADKRLAEQAERLRVAATL
jgi:predicted nucleic acid-binding protein